MSNVVRFTPGSGQCADMLACLLRANSVLTRRRKKTAIRSPRRRGRAASPRLIVLTFARTTELRAARWSEFENLEDNDPIWRIPAERTKMKREHIVPLSSQAVALLRELRTLPGSEKSPFLFPSPSREGHISNNTMLYALYRMGYHGRATVHGFRAMASTALNEMGFRPDVIERQLAHQEQNAVRAAYNLAEYLGERRDMMKYWADCVDVLREGCTALPLRRVSAQMA